MFEWDHFLRLFSFLTKSGMNPSFSLISFSSSSLFLNCWDFSTVSILRWLFFSLTSQWLLLITLKKRNNNLKKKKTPCRYPLSFVRLMNLDWCGLQFVPDLGLWKSSQQSADQLGFWSKSQMAAAIVDGQMDRWSVMEHNMYRISLSLSDTHISVLQLKQTEVNLVSFRRGLLSIWACQKAVPQLFLSLRLLCLFI